MEISLHAPLAKHFERLLELAQNGMSELEAEHGELYKCLRKKVPPHDLERHFSGIFSNFDDDVDTARFMAAYHAFYQVRFNDEWILYLEKAVKSASPAQQPKILKKFFILAELSQREMVMGYLCGLFQLYMPDHKLEDNFVFMNVGNLSDMEDVDVAAIFEGRDKENEFNVVLSRISRQFMINYSPLHFYLNELMPFTRYWASFRDLNRLQERELRNVVVLSQLSTASRLAGSRILARKFAKMLTDRYHFRERVTKHHEGFIRGAITGIASRMEYEPSVDELNPKNDALRLIYLTVSAMKSIHGAKDLNLLRSISHLKRLDPSMEKAWNDLENSGAFICVFRYLTSLLVSREGFIIPSEIFSEEPLEIMSHTLALDGGKDELIELYSGHVKSIRRACGSLHLKLVDHIKKHGLLRRLKDRWTNETTFDGLKGNIAETFANAMKRYHGEVFWEDVSEILRESPKLLLRFMDDLGGLKGSRRDAVISRYSFLLAAADPHGFIEFMEAFSKGDARIANELAASYFKNLSNSRRALERFVSHCFSKPADVTRVVNSLDDKTVGSIIRLVSAEKTDPRYLRVRARLRLNLFMSRLNSRFMEARINEALNVNPALKDQMDHFDELKRTTDVIQASLAGLAHKNEKPALLKMINQAFQHEYTACAFMEIAGVLPERVNARFSQAFDNFIRDLVGTSNPQGKNWAILGGGSVGRADSFYKDFDCIAITGDEKYLKEAMKGVRIIGREIVKIGILPHHHASEMAGKWAMTLNEVVELIHKDGVEKRFVDVAELSSARLIAGDPTLLRHLKEQILNPFIYDDPKPFITAIVTELKSRWKNESYGASHELNLKENSGGLRDINLLAHIIRARLNISGVWPMRFFNEAAPGLPEKYKDMLISLDNNMLELRRVRNLYRLVVAFDDDIIPEHLGSVAILEGIETPEELLESLSNIMKENMEMISSILEDPGVTMQ